jgi:nucleoside-diphosphate-sugar epimerase
VALKRGARRLIHTSTSGVYGLQSRPFDETAPKLGLTSWVNYMRTKAQAEEEVQRGIDRGLDAVLLNPANIVGRYDQTGWARLLRLALDGKLFRVPPGSSSFCHAAEVARAHIAAVRHGKTGANYLLGGADGRYADLICAAGEVAGQTVRARVIRTPLLRMAARVSGWLSHWTDREPLITPEGSAYLCSHLICKSDRAVRELGYTPVPLRRMVEDWYHWSHAEGLLGNRLTSSHRGVGLGKQP